MVSKKYLRSAPHPSTWDDRAAALLESLGGDRKKREEILNQTLSALSDIVEEKQRSGPGRKSNAEHALSFYRHVLTINEQQDATQQSSRELTKRTPRDDEDDQKSKENDDSSTMDSLDFLEQHNDLCEVCNLGGELLCCSTCNLVFHLSCHRPMLKQEPPDHWSCAYCIATGLTGHKRDAKIRRRAQAAVRQMAKNKENNGEDKAEEEEDEAGDDEESEDEEDTGEDGEKESDEMKGDGAVGDENETGEDEEEPAKGDAADLEDTDHAKPAARFMTDESQGKGKDSTERNIWVDSDIQEDNDRKRTSGELLGIENIDERRARRRRRSPALYDPQTCAASEWQSDGVKEWKHLGEEQKENEDECEEDSEDEDDIVDEDSKGPIWCNFCKDDPNVPVCCFCACRICFGKHDKSKLLLCDKCDDEYHIYCLYPPLSTVPGSRKWFCPSCKAAAKKGRAEGGKIATRTKVTGTPSKSFPLDKRGPGRPRKPDGSTEKLSPERRGPGRPRKLIEKGVTSINIERKGPGRPRKTDATSPAEKKESRSRKTETTEDSLLKRGPGRPRKSDPHCNQVANRGPGRPKRIAEEVISPREKRGPGRPRKIDGDEMEAKSPGRPRGRPLKSLALSSSTSPKKAGSAVKRPRSPTPELKSTASGDAGPQKRVRLESSNFENEDDSTSRPGSSRSESPIPLVVQKSRSGRTVKSRAFHDEIDEGEQHLKVSRPSSSQERPKKEEVVKAAKTPLTVEISIDEPVANVPVVGLRSLPVPTKPQSPPPSAPSPVAARAIEIAPSEVPTAPTASLAIPAVAPPLPSPPPVISSSLDVDGPTTVLEVITTPKSVVPVASVELELSVAANATKSIPDPGPVISPPPIPAAAKRPVPPSFPGSSPTIIPGAIPDGQNAKVPRRKPGARECMQMSRRFGVQVIPQRYMTTLLDYCSRGKVEHLIRMRERLDDHSRLLELQLSGLETLVKEKGEVNVVVPAQVENESDLDMPMSPPAIAAVPVRFPPTANISTMQVPPKA